MSRSGYTDEYDNWAVIKWRGAVASSIRGHRGQQLLRDMASAMDAMPVKRLIALDLERAGEYCALGAVGAARGIPLGRLDPEDRVQVADALQIAGALAAEIAFVNDEAGGYDETPEERWIRMRAWVAKQLL